MDPTVSELQAQIDRLSLAVQQARETQGRLEPMEQRLAQLVERCAEILERWADADQRHAVTVGDVESRLTEWAALEQRLQHDALQRSRAIESTVEQEWEALRQRHETPIKQLREQASALGEVCVAAANLSLRGFERAEARFAALERDLHGQLSQLSRDLQTTLAEVRRDVARPAQIAAPVEPFPLEGVMRIHEELRESVRGPAPADATVVDVPVARQIVQVNPVPEPATEAASKLADRMASIEREVTAEREELRDTASRADLMRRNWRRTLVGVGVSVAIVASLAAWGVLALMGRLDQAAARAADAERQVQATSEAASRQVETIRADADRQIAQARQTADKAEIVSNVLAAADLVRYNLVGGNADEPDHPYAQALWSRARGFVLSVSHLPAAPAGSVYEVWMGTDAGMVSAGTITPDASGRVTLVLDDPPRPPRPVTSISVTLEAGGPQAAPTGATVLARGQQ